MSRDHEATTFRTLMEKWRAGDRKTEDWALNYLHTMASVTNIDTDRSGEMKAFSLTVALQEAR